MKTLEQLAREAGGVLMFAGDDEQPAEFNMTTTDLARFRAACRAEALEEAAQITEAEFVGDSLEDSTLCNAGMAYNIALKHAAAAIREMN